jgi:hypothetical protein
MGNWSRSLWTGQKRLRTLCRKSKKADADQPGRLHHIPIEFMIAGILVYQMLPFTGSKEGEVNDLMQKKAGLLTTAIFDYDPDSKLEVYACQGEEAPCD